MTDTIRLALPLLEAAQAQKHVTHNEALIALDALAHLSVRSRNQAAPPPAPAEGDVYLVAAAPSGAFVGHAGAVAMFHGGGWDFRMPRKGWRAYVEGENALVVFDGESWIDAGLALRRLAHLELLGLGATADSTNPLSVKANGALFAALEAGEGGTGHLRFTLNKESATRTVSQLYQSNWSGRAETGLTGDDNFHVKVSADGAAWKEAMVVDAATGKPNFPSGVGEGAPLSFRNRLRNANFGVNQRCVSGTVTLAAGAYGHDGVKAGAAGVTYTFAANGADTAITVTAGSIIMPIEPALIEGGAYVLTHAGSAQARIWQGTSGAGAYANVPTAGLVALGLSANTRTNVEFSAGTVLRPQFEPGAVATAFERRTHAFELPFCQRYFQKTCPQGVMPADGAGFAGAIAVNIYNVTGYYGALWRFATVMRAAPTFVFHSTSANGVAGQWRNGSDTASSPVATIGIGDASVALYVNGGNPMSGANIYYVHATASAEI